MPEDDNQPIRKMVIELNVSTSEALARRQQAEGLNASTLFNRAMQVYDHICKAQEEGKLIRINDKRLTIE